MKKYIFLSAFVVCQSWMPSVLAQAVLSEPKVPARNAEIRGQEVIVQDLIMGIEATQLWKKIQTLLAMDSIKDFAKLAEMFELVPNKPIEEMTLSQVDSMRQGMMRSKNWLIKSANYSLTHTPVTAGSKEYEYRLHFDITLDPANICITKQEVERLYSFAWEMSPTHTPPYQNKTGWPHVVQLTNRQGGFNVFASGCVRTIGKSQALDAVEMEQNK
jgi:hypothetical protein